MTDCSFIAIEVPANPIWSAVPDVQLELCPPSRSAALVAGLIYVPHLKHLHKRAVAMAASVNRGTHARLWRMQGYLCELHGREANDPSGNFVTLGMAVSTARLLGLHKDCGAWTIPRWEKDVRTRLWWSLLLYDRL